jgi:hypothetical protein
MVIRRIAGFIFLIIGAGVFAFQVALALGEPWGTYAMGGAYPGQFPPAMRLASAIQALLWVLFVGIVLARGGYRFSPAVPGVSLDGVGGRGSIGREPGAQPAQPSGGERMIWASVGFVLLASSLIVATRPPAVTSKGAR